MINIRDNVWRPSDGYKYISNGDIFASEIHLRVGDSIDNWHDTNDESTPPPDPEDDATPEDYENALAEMGVPV